MNPLLAPFKWILRGLKGLARLVFPMFARANDLRGSGPGLRRLFHVLTVCVILGILAFVNHALGLERYLRTPFPAISFLREVWLPILFLLFYSLCWLTWILWRLLGPDQDVLEFPDIDLAWEEAMRALGQAGIDVAEAPIFLVLGRPISGDNALFQASQLVFQVRQAPRRIDSPLHVYANRDAIYVTCDGASLTGRLAAILAGETVADQVEEDSLETDRSALFTGDLAAPMPLRTEGLTGGGSSIGDAMSILTIPDSVRLEGPSVFTEPRHAGIDSGARGRKLRQRVSLLRNTDEVERLSGRLRHLCLRIARERRPFCPINGVLLLVPLAATETDGDTKETASLCRRDLANLRETLDVHFPIFAVLCDLERAPGFSEFLRHFPEEQRRRLLGQQFPLVPDLEAGSQLRKFEEGVHWIGNYLFPSLVYKMWRVEKSADEGATDPTAANVRLFHFLSLIRERQWRLGRIITRGIVLQPNGPPMLGGCYVAGTGRDPSREQGFLAGIFHRMVDNQNFVAWTPDALSEENAYRRWALFGYLGLGLVVFLLCVVVVVLYWPFR